MTPAKGSGGADKYKRFAWQGIQLTVPTDWELVSTQGSYDSGYVALADTAATRLQMKWDLASEKADLSEAASRYIRHVRKTARKAGRDVTVNRDLKLAALRGKQIECYEWRADSRCIAMLSRCEQCNRVVHILLLGKTQASMRTLARTVFASLKDHPQRDVLEWQFYDMQFASPKGMTLRRHELKTGCIRMLFAQKQAELEFVRVSLAQVLLSRQSLDEWFRVFYAPELKRWRLENARIEHARHPILGLRGRPGLIARLTNPFGRRKQIQVACWHCTQSNRLFIVRHSGPATQQEVFRRAVQSLKCCG